MTARFCAGKVSVLKKHAVAVAQKITCYLLLPAALLFAASAHAEQVLAVGTEFARIFERGEDGQFSGLGVDLVRVLARQRGDTVRFEMYPWSRAQWMVETGQAQILIGPYKTPDREKRFAFASRPFYRDDLVFLMRGGDRIHWSGDFADIGKHPVGIILGWAYGSRFEHARDKFHLEVANTLGSGLNMLRAGHIDLLATNWRNTEDYIRKNPGFQDYVMLNPPIGTLDGYLAYCKKQCDAIRKDYDAIFDTAAIRAELTAQAANYHLSLP